MRTIPRLFACLFGAALVAALAPATAFAQATIAGVVRDTSGAVLPGVTVEAASSVLIEKARTAVSDSNGRYQIVDLRAGSYVVTFTLPGFATVKREGIELTGVATAAVNAELRVGAIEETVTVTGETPIVDVQSVRRQATINSETLGSIPTARGYSGVMLLVPAIQTQGTSPANVQATPGMDEEMLAQKVDEKLRAAAERQNRELQAQLTPSYARP